MADRTMIEWGIGFLAGGLLVFFLPAIRDLITQFIKIESETLAITSVIAILCGLALLFIGAKSSGKRSR